MVSGGGGFSKNLKQSIKASAFSLNGPATDEKGRKEGGLKKKKEKRESPKIGLRPPNRFREGLGGSKPGRESQRYQNKLKQNCRKIEIF